METEVLLDRCWSQNTVREFSSSAIADTINGWRSFLEQKILAFDSNGKISFAKDYLWIIGYDNLNIPNEENHIEINYTLPGDISMFGIASIEDSYLSESIIGNDTNFFLIFHFTPYNQASNHTGSNTRDFRLNDYIEILLQILAIKLYRTNEHDFRLNSSLTSWFFKYLELMLDFTKADFQAVEKRWNTIASSQIEQRDW